MISSEKWHARRALGVLSLSLLLAACGSGGGDSDSGTDGGTAGGGGTGGGNAAESATLLADVEMAANGTAALRVWDPAQPTTLVASQSPVAASEQVQYGWARSFDAATRTERQTARTLAVHTSNGHAWLTDLRGGQSHTPRQLSSLDLVDSTRSVVPLALDGTTAWANVMRTGLIFAVHSSMSSTDAPLRGEVLAALPDSTGAGRYIAVATSNDAGQSGLSVLAADGSSVGFSAVPGGSLGIAWVGFDPAQAGRAYVVVNQQLRRLIWNDAGVSLDPSFSHAMQATNTPQAGGVSDATGLWLLDGATLLHIVGDSVTPLGAFADAPRALWDAGDAVVVKRSVSLTPQCCTSYETMNKASGIVSQIYGGVNSASLFDASDGKALFRQTNTWGWAVLDTQGQVLSQGNGPILGAVYAAERIAGRAPALQGFMACTPDASTGMCGAGPVSQFGLDGNAQMSMAELTAGTTLVHPLQKDYVAGLPTSMTMLASNSGNRDLWQVTPGVAGSLQRVTQHLP
ncbi:hypothetical protein [Ideonella sp.]|uniref:hypothetical protein n=1 Tax=Ideonella sp. TaxID=1929293 RepID=UPI003BB4AFA5